LDDDTSSVDFSEVNAAQDGVLSFDQLLACGFTGSKIKNMVQSKRWQRIHRGIFATFSGPLGRRAAIWAASHNAVASHYTAAELCGLNNSGRHTIHVTIPNNQRGRSLAGVTVHRSDRIMATARPTRVPPQTRIEETILDLTDLTTSPDQVVGLLSAACGHRLTTPDLLHQTALVRPRLKWRELIDAALSDVADGTHSPLERYYYRDVERAHGLPNGTRQAAVDTDGGRIYQDVHYAGFRTVVELDGRAAHPVAERSRHLGRDNAAALRGDVVLHFGWSDVTYDPCETAVRVARALRNGGWGGSMIKCSKLCKI
jgi:hypothetical protein